MSNNLILEVERIERYMREGFPEGVEPLAKDVPLLLHRINELEVALVPFARAGLQENDGKPLIHVYQKDCKRAFDKLSRRVAIATRPVVVEEYPAEG